MMEEPELRALISICHEDFKVLEYGSGGSTRFISQRCKFLVTVESDRKFLKAVEKGNDELTNISYIYANIGPTKTYGQPIKLLSCIYKKRWKSYAQSPWNLNEGINEYDTIFIDGRFRVACALTSVLENRKESFSILIDDYFKRAEYKDIEMILGEPSRHGHAALFTVKKAAIDIGLAVQLLAKFENDYN
jgi:hypothetical protein